MLLCDTINCQRLFHERGVVMEPVKTGLVLEGGGMRGIYTAGVLDVMMSQKVKFDGVIGVSAGAIHGCSFVSEQQGRNIRYYKKYCNDKRFMSFKNFFQTGDMAGEQFCYHDLPEKLDPFDYVTFNKSDTEFYVGCSNVQTGQPEYIHLTDMKKEIDFLRASASLPYVSRIVEAGGMKLLDGGCTDSIPVETFRKMGFNKCVVVLTRHKGYVKRAEKSMLADVFYRKYPKFAEAVKTRPEKYNQTIRYIENLEEKGEIFVIRPSVKLNVGRTKSSPKQLQEAYDIGKYDAIMQMDKMIKWLNN